MRRLLCRSALILCPLTALIFASSARPQTTGSSRDEAVVARSAIGVIDADVLDGSGHVLGYLRADVGASGRADGIFRAAPSSGATAQVVSVRPSGTKLRLVGEDGLRLDASVAAHGRLTGAGQLGSLPVRLQGEAGEQLPALRKGMKMLVVGHPHGAAYEALLGLFRPVHYRPGVETRARFLSDRAELAPYAAIVFGPGGGPRSRQTLPLLYAFYDTGRWVIDAPALRSAETALGALEGYTPDRDSAGMAVRATGPPGGDDGVRPTILYPEAPKVVRLSPGPPAQPSKAVLQADARHRADWFRRQLLDYGSAQMSSPVSKDDRQLQGANGSVDFNLPFNAAAIELAVPYFHQFTLTGSANGVAYGTVVDPCGHDPHTHDSWCPNTWAGKWGDPLSACEYFLSHGDQMVEGSVVRDHGGLQPSGAYNIGTHVLTRNGWHTFRQLPGKHQCPFNVTQTGSMQGNDYYYAIYDPQLKQHSLVVLTDTTINASDGGKLALDDQTDGTYQEYWGSGGNIKDTEERKLPETMLFLGAYTNDIKVSGGPQLTNNVLEYSGNRSFPTNTITFTAKSTSVSSSQSFGIGIFGDMATGSYDRTESHSASVSMDVPSWQVFPVPTQRAISYRWTTNDPVTWQQIAAADEQGKPVPYVVAKAPWGLNPINISGFSPTSLTAWVGSATYGQLSITSDRTVSLVDHFSYYDSRTRNEPSDAFWVTNLDFSDGPDAVTPATTNPVGPGINLCDPLVRAPAFVSQCTTK